MPMIDVGIKIEVAGPITAPATKPTTWTTLKDCVTMPALIQPSAKVPTNFIGDEFIGEMLGKRTIAGLDFVFAYDGGKTGSQFRMLSDLDDDNAQRYFRVTYPAVSGESRGTMFEFLAEFEVTLVAPVAGGEVDYAMSVTPCRSTLLSDLVEVVYPDETDPLSA